MASLRQPWASSSRMGLYGTYSSTQSAGRPLPPRTAPRISLSRWTVRAATTQAQTSAAVEVDQEQTPIARASEHAASRTPGPTTSSSPGPNASAADRKGKAKETLESQLLELTAVARQQWSSLLALFNTKRSTLGADAEKQLAQLGMRINEVTGYDEVERLKTAVFQKEQHLESLRAAARQAKEAYDAAVASQSSTQRDVNALLERKHTWSESDVVKFTTLVRAEHSSSQALIGASARLKEAEMAVDKAFTDLMQAILGRYHEEQMWSDKIRGVSTWANIAGLLVNLVVFVGAIAVVEPWKRRRLVERLEERSEGVMRKVEDGLKGLEGKLESLLPRHHVTAGLATGAGAVSASSADPALDAEQAPASAVSGESGEQETKVVVEPVWTANQSNYITPVVPWLPPQLDILATPSHDRDVIVAGIGGVAGGAVLLAMLSWALR